MRSTFYRGKVDGDIKDYLIEDRESGLVASGFVGYEPFKLLWDLGVVTPKITSIRLMFNYARGDEHYVVVSKEQMEGVKLMAHLGIEGVHNIEEVLSKTDADYWEIDDLHPRVFRR